MNEFLVRLLIGIGIIWLTQVILDTLAIKEPGKKFVFLAVVILAVLWIVTGNSALQLF